MLLEIDGPDHSVVRVLWAALCAMTLDVHAPQDQLSSDEWMLAERLFISLDQEMNQNGRV